jgi:predicted nucleotidyltransferase
MRGMMSGEEYLRRMRDPKWYGEQNENGVDLSLIRENLKLTPRERLCTAERARVASLELQEIARRQWGSDVEIECGEAEDNRAETGLIRIAELLTNYGVAFIVIGGQAEILMGSSLARFGTRDVDLCYRRTPDNLKRLAEALKEIGARLRAAPAEFENAIDARTLSIGCNFQLETTLGSLDLIGWVEPLGEFDEIVGNAQKFTVGSLQLAVISLEDLIKVRQCIGRSKDKLAIEELRAIAAKRNHPAAVQDNAE